MRQFEISVARAPPKRGGIWRSSMRARSSLFFATHITAPSTPRARAIGPGAEELVRLDTDANSVLIFSELGIYQFLGTLCDNI